MRRVDLLVVATYGVVAIVTCGAGLLLGWLAQRAYVAWWPWVSAHADAIVAVVLTVCAVLLIVLAVAERAKRDNPSW